MSNDIPVQESTVNAFALRYSGADSLSTVLVDQEQPLQGKYKLTATEREMLQDCEARIQSGINTFIDVGEALATVRRGRLYKEEFLSFEEYCQEKWGFGRYRALQYIQGAETASQLVTFGHRTNDLNVAQTRVLQGLTPEVKNEVLSLARRNAGHKPLETRHIREAKKAILPVEKEYAPSSGDQVELFPTRQRTSSELPTVTHEMIEAAMDMVREELDESKHSTHLLNAFAKLESIVRAFVQQNSKQEVGI